MNIYQIAEKAGVSIATVSRVLNNSPSVSEKTRKKVLQIMEKDHYQPNVFARGLTLDSIKQIGVICTDVSDIFIAKALSLVQAHLYRRNYDTLLFCVGSYSETTLKHMRYLQSKHVDVIILIGSAFSDTVDRKKLCAIARSIPIIMINGFVDSEGIYSIYAEEASSICQVTDQLCARGNTNIVLLYDSMTQSTQRKLEGFRQGLSNNGIAFDEKQLVNAGTSLESSKATIEALIAAGNCPDAVVATSDLIAIGAVRAFESHGLRCNVVGYDNTILCNCMVPGLTSIDPHIENMCDTAALILDELLQKKTPERIHAFSPELIWRESFPKEE